MDYPDQVIIVLVKRVVVGINEGYFVCICCRGIYKNQLSNFSRCSIFSAWRPPLGLSKSGLKVSIFCGTRSKVSRTLRTTCMYMSTAVRWMGTVNRLATIFTKGDNFVTVSCIESHLKWRNLHQRSKQTFLFSQTLLIRVAKGLPPLQVYPYSLYAVYFKDRSFSNIV